MRHWSDWHTHTPPRRSTKLDKLTADDSTTQYTSTPKRPYTPVSQHIGQSSPPCWRLQATLFLCPTSVFRPNSSTLYCRWELPAAGIYGEARLPVGLLCLRLPTLLFGRHRQRPLCILYSSVMRWKRHVEGSPLVPLNSPTSEHIVRTCWGGIAV